MTKKAVKSKAQELCDKLVGVFSKEKEVLRICTFGKLAENISDNFSDVDLRIISKDPGLTQNNLHKIIEGGISPILGTFTLASNKDSFAEMIMLKNYSPYQKIDLGLKGMGYHQFLTLWPQSTIISWQKELTETAKSS